MLRLASISVVAILLALSPSAHAGSDARAPATSSSPGPSRRAVTDSPRTPVIYVGASAEDGFDLGFRLGAGFEVAHRPWKRDIWLRGKTGVGIIVDLDEKGAIYVEGAVGIEAQHCLRGRWICAFAGADAGVLDVFDGFRFEGVLLDGAGVSFTPRVGIDVGRGLRLRLTLQSRVAWFGDGIAVGPVLGASVLGTY